MPFSGPAAKSQVMQANRDVVRPLCKVSGMRLMLKSGLEIFALFGPATLVLAMRHSTVGLLYRMVKRRSQISNGESIEKRGSETRAAVLKDCAVKTESVLR